METGGRKQSQAPRRNFQIRDNYELTVALALSVQNLKREDPSTRVQSTITREGWSHRIQARQKESTPSARVDHFLHVNAIFARNSTFQNTSQTWVSDIHKPQLCEQVICKTKYLNAGISILQAQDPRTKCCAWGWGEFKKQIILLIVITEETRCSLSVLHS